MNCPACNQLLSERGAYCKSCGIQARCLKCREVLEPESMACVECGTIIAASSNGNGTHHSVTAPIAPDRNTISYQEDRNSRRFDASLSDKAIEGLGGVFGDLFIQRGAVKTTRPTAADTPKTGLLPFMEPAETETPPVPEQPANPEQDSERTKILKLFSLNGNSLELIDNRLKAKSCADYYRRLTYLTIYAYECQGRLASWEDLLKILKKGKVWNANSRSWLSKKAGYARDDEDRLKLIVGAREEAQKILSEALDPNIDDKWNPDRSTTGKRRKKNE